MRSTTVKSTETAAQPDNRTARQPHSQAATLENATQLSGGRKSASAITCGSDAAASSGAPATSSEIAHSDAQRQEVPHYGDKRNTRAADSADGYLSEMDRLTKLLDDLQQVDANFDEAAWPASGTDYVFDMLMGLKQRRREAIRYPPHGMPAILDTLGSDPLRHPSATPATDPAEQVSLTQAGGAAGGGLMAARGAAAGGTEVGAGKGAQGQGWPQAVLTKVNALLGTPSNTLAATQQQTRHDQARTQAAASAAQESRKGSVALYASREQG
ncbi:hypothetical protein QJQ45_026774 [Haematococcus lacustris]|nr:hypothetical protein QJQ45_026774 [Haematococcus lacustris]